MRLVTWEAEPAKLRPFGCWLSFCSTAEAAAAKFCAKGGIGEAERPEETELEGEVVLLDSWAEVGNCYSNKKFNYQIHYQFC